MLYDIAKGRTLAGIFIITSFLIFSSFMVSGQSVRINEIMASNVSSLYDEDGDVPDWIELYNYGDTMINLSGFGLSDDDTLLFKWVFPDYNIDSGEYAVIFASDKNRLPSRRTWKTIIDISDEWKYYIPDSDIGDSWKTIEFKDDSWKIGKTSIGYGDEDDSTEVDPGTMAVYLRKYFIVEDTSKIKEAFLHIDYDDAFVAYINGAEVARANIGEPGMPVNFDDPANTYTEPLICYGSPPEAFNISDTIHSLLHPGENIIAIELHNHQPSSSDLTIIPFLTMGYEYAPGDRDTLSEYITFTGGNLHTNFKISSEGEAVYLTDTTGNIIDSVGAIELQADISYGRIPGETDTLGFFMNSTPGFQNEGTVYSLDSIPKPVFSEKGGLHPLTFNLTLSASPGDTIYYTTDGSVPDKNSNIYQSYLSIQETSVVKARIIRSGYLPGPVRANTYIIGRQHSIPVVSLSTNPENLWDEQSGIYVNFLEDWEKPGHIEMFETDGSKGFELDAGIKMYGGWTRNLAQKSFAIMSRNRYSSERITHRIFKEKPIDEFKTIILRNSGNDWNNTMFRDAMMTRLTSPLGFDYQAYRPAVLYLNGEYWGIQNIREKINEHFIYDNHGIDPDSVDMLENNVDIPINLVNGDPDEYYELLDFLEVNDISIEENYNQVRQQMDVDNYIKYQLSQIYFDNTDWPGNNVKFWQKRGPSGKWRWILYDTDFSFNNSGNNTLAFALDPNQTAWPNPAWSTFLFRSLITNPDFKHDFSIQFCDHLNTTFMPGPVKELIESMKQTIDGEISDHLNRWGGGSYSNWVNNVNGMKSFADYRRNNVFNHIRGTFGYSDDNSIVLEVSPNQGGKIRINTVFPGSYPWRGRYFPELLLELVAIPNPGFRFTGWSGHNTSLNDTINLQLLANYSYMANFEPDGTGLNSIVINEINYNSADDRNSGDWIEIYNAGATTMDLGGWIMKDDNDLHAYAFPASLTIEPDNYLLLSNDITNFTSVYPEAIVSGVFDFGFSAAGEYIRLFDNQGRLADSVYYLPIHPWPEAANGTGATLALNDPYIDNSLAINWHALDIPSPGAENPEPVSTIEEFSLNTGHNGIKVSAYPNPFTSKLTFDFMLEESGLVQLELYDISGKLVYVVCNRQLFSGYHEIDVSIDDQGDNSLRPGIYIYKIKTGKGITVGKVIKTR